MSKKLGSYWNSNEAGNLWTTNYWQDGNSYYATSTYWSTELEFGSYAEAKADFDEQAKKWKHKWLGIKK